MKSLLLPLLHASLRSLGAPEGAEIVLDLPRDPVRGDLSTGVAFPLARHFGKLPAEIAQDIVDGLALDPALAEVWIAGGGFINFRCTPGFLHEQLRDALRQGEYFGQTSGGESRNIVVIVPASADTALPATERPIACGAAIAGLLRWTGNHVSVRTEHSGDATGTDEPDEIIIVVNADRAASGTDIADGLRKRHTDLSHITLLPVQPASMYVGGSPDEAAARNAGEFTPAEAARIIPREMLRFLLLTRERTEPLAIDAALMRDRTERNPFIHLLHARARAAGVLRHAAMEGIATDGDADLSLLLHPLELALIRQLLLLPELIARAARELEPKLLTDHLAGIARTFDEFFRECRIIPEPPPLRAARLRLLAAAYLALGNGLESLGIIPEREAGAVSPV